MHLRVVVPVIGDQFDDLVLEEASAHASAGTKVDVVHLDHGPASIESEYDELLAGPPIIDRVRQAAVDGADAVFVTCFGDPGVAAAREVVDIPVVGGFEPAVLLALSLGERVQIVTVLSSVLPLLTGLIKKYALTGRLLRPRVIDTSVTDLAGHGAVAELIHAQAREALDRHEADVVVLGCTGMLGLARSIQDRLASEGPFVPVVDPTAAAVRWLETQHALGLRPSRTTYQPPPAKERTGPGVA